MACSRWNCSSCSSCPAASAASRWRSSSACARFAYGRGQVGYPPRAERLMGVQGIDTCTHT
jgi:hypothetical protein